MSILRCVQQGMSRWSSIAQHVEGRSGKQCRDRWFNYLEPDSRKGGWTESEDRILEMLVQQFNPESVHNNFRLWLTSMPSKDFPVQVRCRRSSGRGTDSLRHYVRRLPFLEQSYMELSS